MKKIARWVLVKLYGLYIHISVMSGKLEGIYGVNVNTLSSSYCNRKVDEFIICFYCYSRRMLRTFRRKCVGPFQRNSERLSVPVSWDDLPRFPAGSVVRFNAHGELINRAHAENLLRIAEKNPESVFALWTKRPELVPNRKVPNLVKVYSSPRVGVVEEIPEGFDVSFTVFPDFDCDMCDEEAGTFQCRLSCRDCMACYTPGSPPLYVVEEIREVGDWRDRQKRLAK